MLSIQYVIHDPKYRFKSAFDTETGAYVRTGILDENGKDTGVDPFMASFPHLIDVGVIACCILISRYGCEKYFAPNKELLFYERQRDIIREIEKLEL